MRRATRSWLCGVAGSQVRDQSATASFVLELGRERPGVNDQPVDFDEPGERVLLEHRAARQAALEDATTQSLD